jgi:pimeloyl-ACP methyl ester carboxylesterase
MLTVFIPGLLCSPRLYAPVVPSVWAFGPTMVADTRRDDSLSGIAERLLETVPGCFALVGLSLGGYVALEVARQAPDRIGALALLSTSARPDSQEQTENRRAQVSMVRQGGFDDLVDAAFPVTVCRENEADESLRANFRAMAADVGVDAFERQQHAAITRPDARPHLAGISCPTLVLHGAGDRLIDPENGRELAAGIPDATFELLDRCGHSPTVEQPEATAAALTELLTRADLGE